MKRRFVLSVVLLFSIGIGIGLASTKLGFDQVFRSRSVAANEQTSSREGQPDTAPSGQVVFEEFTSESDAADAPPLTAQVTSASEMVENLNHKAISQLPVGWIHIREERVFDQDSENNGVLPNGIAIPHHQVNDIWYQVDESHRVIEMVSIMRSSEGQIIQVGVYSNGTSWNSATGTVESSDPYVLNAFDGQFLWDLGQFEASGSQPQITEEVLLDGRAGLLFVIQDKFEDSPVELASYELPAIGAEIHALFGQDDGYLHRKEVIFRFLDGSERVSISLKQEITFEEPTEEAFSYLAKKEEEAKK